MEQRNPPPAVHVKGRAPVNAIPEKIARGAMMAKFLKI
jgi:hypothetical protein